MLIKRKILGKMCGSGRGKKVYARSDFSSIGSRATVTRTLNQLVADGQIRRLGRGLYDLPRVNQLLNAYAVARTDDIIDVVQRRDNVRIMPDGASCANHLGLTNSVPAQHTYLTDGSGRKLSVDGRTIILKHAGGKWMGWYGRPGRDVVLALRWLGRENITAEVRRKLAALPSDVRNDLLSGLGAMPQWMASVVNAILTDA